ncbi:T9SS type A sorting domain-containing protein [Polaribacter sp. Asnod1-A03]|uniref:T9SS type A sorting domain-containing protein n=1 Tax=Polaribacter sp. Asnod1-A03 TaxID=3160581 RepID=UPI003868DB43
MKKILLFLSLLFTTTLFSQVQIGSNIDGEAALDFSGWSLSLSSNGSIVAIGAVGNDGNGSGSGHVRVYENVGGIWTQIGSDIDGEAIADRSGVSLSLSSNGKIVAIGAERNDGNGTISGHVRVYENIGGVWTQVGSDIDGEAAEDQSGFSVSMSSDGSNVAIGAYENNTTASGVGAGEGRAGHVRVYENISGVWTQIGSDIDGEDHRDSSGINVSLSSEGSIVAIGANRNDGNGNQSGHVRVYENIGGVWSQIGSDIDGETAEDQSGWEISLSDDGTIVAIGAQYNDGNGINSGHVRVYENIGGVWIQIGSDIDGEAAGDLQFHVSLSGDGSIVAIGAESNDGNGNGAGHVRIYKNIAGTWTQIGSDINGEATGDGLGFSVSLSSDGNIVAAGAPGNDNNGSSSGHVRVFDLSSILSLDSFVLKNTSIYPNPTNKEFTVHLGGNIQFKKLSVYNTLGKYILESYDKEVNIENLSKGLYFVKIISNQGKSIKKLVVN